MSTELIFQVEESPEGGFEASALGESIFTVGNTVDELRSNIREAVECHFETESRPKMSMFQTSIIIAVFLSLFFFNGCTSGSADYYGRSTRSESSRPRPIKPDIPIVRPAIWESYPFNIDNIRDYFNKLNRKLDEIEGVWQTDDSDPYVIAIIKDTSSLKRDYIGVILEAPSIYVTVWLPGDVKFELLQLSDKSKYKLKYYMADRTQFNIDAKHTIYEFHPYDGTINESLFIERDRINKHLGFVLPVLHDDGKWYGTSFVNYVKIYPK